MARKYGFGLASIKMGDIAEDGGMGENLTQITDTVPGTATFTSEEATTQDIMIEEEDDPVIITSTAGKKTIAFSSRNMDSATLERLFGGTRTPYIAVDGVKTLGAITPGSLYTDGYYVDVPLTGGAGSGATANIVVDGGAVVDVEMVNRGIGYDAADSLSASAANIGGTGSGFAVVAATVQATTAQADKWEAPASQIELEQSFELTDKRSNIIKVVRAKVVAKFNWGFSKEDTAKVDVVATVLTPSKVNTPPYTIHYPNP